MNINFDFKDTLESVNLKEPWYEWRFNSKHVELEITWLRWGFGFDIGYHYRFGFSLWAGPFYLSIDL